MKHFNVKASVSNFKKFSKGKRIYIDWIYSKHDAGFIEISKTVLFNQLTILKAYEVVYNISDSGNFYITELIFKTEGN